MTPPWLPYAIGIGGGIAGPSGILWAVLNWQRDDAGKKISQTGEIVVMFQALIEQLEASLGRAEAELSRSQLETNGALAALEACHQECVRLRDELEVVRRDLARTKRMRGDRDGR